MAKKRNKLDTILNRAEKLFETKNYLLAEIEFKKARQKLNSPEIEEKLAICLKYTQEIKGREFVKKGQKALGKNDISEAVSCFREAEKLLQESWIKDKILDLEQSLSGSEAAARAEIAARNKDYPAAADLYLELAQMDNNEKYLARGAICLVKGNAFNKAVELFKALDSFNDAAHYHFGYALAKQGRYLEALARWEMIDSRDADFLGQFNQVLGLAFGQLKAALKAGADINEMLAGANRLLGLGAVRDNDALVKGLEILADYCRLSLMMPLWETGDYSAVAQLLDAMVSGADPAINILYAATYYHLAETQPDLAGALSDYWLSAVYSGGLMAVGQDSEKQDKVRQQLIRMAEKRFSSMAGFGNGCNSTAAKQFGIDKTLMADLWAISRDRQASLPKLRICSPGFANRYGFSETILTLIRENKAHFRDETHYLETGACYSRAWESFYALKTGNTQSAFDLLGQTGIDAAEPADEFTRYALALVRFKYGHIAIANKDKNFLDYFDAAGRLFAAIPGIEEQFLQEMMQYEGPHVIEYEAVLSFLHKLRPSEPIAEALSFFMGQAAVARFNMGKINNKQFMVTLGKALGIDPDNEFVLQLREQTDMEVELEALYNAMNKRKMGKAATLAKKSRFPEIRDRFFDFIEQMMKFIQDSGPENSFRTVEYTDLINTCMAVDPYHPVIKTLKMKIQLLKD